MDNDWVFTLNVFFVVVFSQGTCCSYVVHAAVWNIQKHTQESLWSMINFKHSFRLDCGVSLHSTGFLIIFTNTSQTSELVSDPNYYLWETWL